MRDLGVWMLNPVAAVLGSCAAGKQAAVINVCSGLATGGVQRVHCPGLI